MYDNLLAMRGNFDWPLTHIMSPHQHNYITAILMCGMDGEVGRSVGVCVNGKIGLHVVFK